MTSCNDRNAEFLVHVLGTVAHYVAQVSPQETYLAIHPIAEFLF